MHKTETKETRAEFIEFIYHLQDDICRRLEAADGQAVFMQDEWQRAEGKGGGGLTRVIQNGNIFEKGGVNTSVVYGHVTERMRKHMTLNGVRWFACGISLVLHPLNPFIPTVHCNYRMFELYNENDEVSDQWFGGGTDLTPYYLFEEDARHFHQVYKDACDEFDPGFYFKFKAECDNYFMNSHRSNERRGIGGIFYEHERPDEKYNKDFWFSFAKACGNAFIPSYLPIVERRKNITYSSENKHWQEIRRGRYVEFNLLHDRGTLFGLKTNGRTESILMSLPPTVRFEYNYLPPEGSEEDRLQKVCLHPREWLADQLNRPG